MSEPLTLGKFREATRDLPDDTRIGVCLMTPEDMLRLVSRCRNLIDRAEGPEETYPIRVAHSPFILPVRGEGVVVLAAVADSV